MKYWDTWEQDALAAGVAPALAQLGREIMRDYSEHGHPEEELGAEADGPMMLTLCLQAPLLTELRFLGDQYARAADFRTEAQEDGEMQAYTLLSARFGSSDALDAAIAAEERAWCAIWASARKPY